MSPRPVAAVLLASAAVAYLGVARPAQRRIAAASEELRRVRDERRAAQQRLKELEREETARARALAGLRSAAGSAEPTTLRASVVESLRSLPVSDVRLSVGSGRAPVGATLRLGASGRFADVVRTAGHLTRPGSGLVLQRVSFVPSAGGNVVLNLEGGSLGETRP